MKTPLLLVMLLVAAITVQSQTKTKVLVNPSVAKTRTVKVYTTDSL